MRAIAFTEYGAPDVLHLVEAPKPTPRKGEVSVRVVATSVAYGDTLARNLAAVARRDFHMSALFWLITRLTFGWKRPKVQRLGSEFSGVIESVGAGVTAYRPGDDVFGYLGARMGAYAEYVCMPADAALAPKPANLTYQQAAVVPMGAMTALSLLDRAKVRRGERVLVLGASGGIGAAAVQLARHLGAEVTGVCGALRLDFVKALGAAHVIDYGREDFTRNGHSYDVILDVLGKSSFARCKGSLAPGGRYVPASFKSRQLLQMMWTSVVGDKRVICALAPNRAKDLLRVRALIEAGHLVAIIDRSFPLEQAARAHAYVESGQRRGQVAISVGPVSAAPGPQVLQSAAVV